MPAVTTSTPGRKPTAVAWMTPALLSTVRTIRATMPPVSPFQGRAATEPAAVTSNVSSSGTRISWRGPS